MSVTLSYREFSNRARDGSSLPSRLFVPFHSVDRGKYAALAQKSFRDDRGVAFTFRKLRTRLGSHWLERHYAAQSGILSYSQLAFPSYRFILSELIGEDWLAIVDWRKFQRDHLIHQPLTAYVVKEILELGSKLLTDLGVDLLDWCVDIIMNGERTSYLREYLAATGVPAESHWFRDCSISRELWKCLFVETAYLAAAFHDMGYPWRYISHLRNRLDHAALDHRDFADEAQHVIQAFSKRLVLVPFNDYRLCSDRDHPVTWPSSRVETVSESYASTHGLPGALGFLILNDVIRQYPNGEASPIRRFCVEWAAMAIMMHDMKGVYWGKRDQPTRRYLRLRVERDPLSTLLTLADVVQEFSRPSAVFDKTAASHARVRYKTACESTTLDFDAASRTLSIRFKMASPSDRANKLRFLEKENREFFDPRHGFLDLSALGVRAARFEVE